MILIANGEGASGVESAARLLMDGAPALDAIEAGIRVVEANPDVHSVGPNSWPNILGTLQLDAAIMDGTTRRSGAVGAVEGFAHPISIARAVSERLPHEILVGEGAARFAREIGAERSPPLSNLVEETWRGIVRRNGAQPDQLADDPRMPLIDLARAAIDPEKVRDTTVYLAMDAAGTIASGGSTSGWAWKYPGRLGDTPIIGAGSYADTRYGAAACTHTGEMTIRTGTARAIVLYMKLGHSLDDAVAAAIADLAELAGGQLGTVVIHALDRKGRHAVVCHQPTEPIFYWLWTPDMPAPERRSAESR
jgi:isoaspartyl peptidase/L-asparaginase-like protein (Ntn-hydrolase superfamily)